MKVDVLVIGAGPAGTVAASILKNEGFDVRIVEKQKFPRFVIGESLLPRCMENLEYAGLLDTIKGAEFQKKYGAKFVSGGEVCDFNFINQYTKGYTWTWQVQRADFDQLLAKETERKGVAIDYEAEVVDVLFNKDHSSVTTVKKADGITYNVEAKFIVDGSGFGRVLPRILNLDQPSYFPVRAALFTHLEDKNRPAGIDGNRITVIIYSKDVWIWIIPFADGNTSIGLVGDPDIINKHEGTPVEQFDKWLNEVTELKDRFKISDAKFEPRKIMGYSSAVSKLYGEGFVLTGNSTEFLDPVFSSGVTLATESAATAAKLLARQLKGEQVDWEKDYSDYIKSGVDVFRTFVTTWYDGTLHKIFFTTGSNKEMKKQICSVLAGYVWDKTNPFVKKHNRAVKALAQVIGQQ